MLTPIEIQSLRFKSGFGFVKKEVEEFMNAVSEDYSQLYKENKEMKEELKILANALTHYRTIENEMKTALELSKRAAQELKESAKQIAIQIEQEARNNADLILSEANIEVEQLQKQLLTMVNQYYLFKEQSINQANDFIEALQSKELQVPESIKEKCL